ncbi:MAG: DUF6069 family protein [Chloroflexota bacterium]|jgi:hypothetical protein|nr:DUF6069 family protein [Chloroflexota bacterium]
MNATQSQADHQPSSTSEIVRAGIIAVITAVVANVIVYLIARAVEAIPDDLPSGAEEIGIPAVIFSCVLTITVATVAFWLFNRFSENPVRNFVILSGIVFVTSLTGPFTIDGASVGLITSLLVMHAVAAGVVVVVFTRLGRR